jgi:hypothetical protein
MNPSDGLDTSQKKIDVSAPNRIRSTSSIRKQYSFKQQQQHNAAAATTATAAATTITTTITTTTTVLAAE